ncbi:MAG: hypothetical protein PHP54_01190, partial [Clostridia bacterium]|nr:hypothetical protein [Clostridia bacterium]
MDKKLLEKENNLCEKHIKNIKQENGYHKTHGISLLVLVITIVIMIILATATILILNRQDTFNIANDVTLKTDMMAMLNSQEARLSDLMHDKLGDKSKISEEDFKGLVPDEYLSQGFVASKDGMIYAGEDEHTKKLAVEMGYIIPGNITVPNIEGIFVSNVTTNGARVEVGIDAISGIKYTYKYSKDNGATWSNEVSYDTTYQIKGMTDNTIYEVKVEASSGESKKESGVERLVTKELLLGKADIRETSKTGPVYVDDKWTSNDIYVGIYQSKTGNTTYELTGANTSAPQTIEKMLTIQGITQLTLKTTDGTNTKVETHNILIDKEAPTAAVSIEPTTNSIIAEVSNSKDNLSGIKHYKFYLDGVLKDTQTPKDVEPKFEFLNLIQGRSYEVIVEIEDNVGNKKEFVDTKVVDKITAEKDVQVKLEPSGWTNQNVKLTLTYPEVPGLIGQYSEDGNNWKDVTQIGKGAVHIENIPENTTIYVRYKDKNGQTGSHRSISITNIDKIDPVIKNVSQTPTAATNQMVIVTIVMQDNLSGLVGCMISKDPSLGANAPGWTPITSTTTETSVNLSVSENGLYYVYAKDVAGNVKRDSINITNIDKIAPTIKIEPNGGNYVIPEGQNKAKLKARTLVNDVGGSGINNNSLLYVWSTSEAAPTTGYELYTNGAEIVFENATEGTWYLYVKAEDNAGNAISPNPTKSQKFIVGNSSLPENKITLTPNITSWTNQSVKVTIKYGTNLNYNKMAGINGLTTANATELTVDKNATVYAEATDAAGNKITAS